jgi:polyisoprenoid-binding protein YceI
MTPQRTTPDRGPILMLMGIVVLAVAGVGLWYLFFRPAGPAPVSLGETPTQAAIASAANPTATASPATASSSGSAPSSGGASAAAGGGSGAGGDVSGTWNVDPSVGSFSDFSGSFVGYRVQETLANVGAATAVGRTPDVTGSLTINDTTVTAADFTADLTTLQSDDPRRDGQLRNQALETGQYPTATFKLTQPLALGSVPAGGETVKATATGDLTLHGVTKTVQIPLEARLADGVVSVVGSLPIQFADYSMNPPRSMMVLSVADNGILELQLQLTQAAA